MYLSVFNFALRFFSCFLLAFVAWDHLIVSLLFLITFDNSDLGFFFALVIVVLVVVLIVAEWILVVYTCYIDTTKYSGSFLAECACDFLLIFLCIFVCAVLLTYVLYYMFFLHSDFLNEINRVCIELHFEYCVFDCVKKNELHISCVVSSNTWHNTTQQNKTKVTLTTMTATTMTICIKTHGISHGFDCDFFLSRNCVEGLQLKYNCEVFVEKKIVCLSIRFCCLQSIFCCCVLYVRFCTHIYACVWCVLLLSKNYYVNQSDKQIVKKIKQ